MPITRKKNATLTNRAFCSQAGNAYNLSIHFFTSSFVWPVFFWIRPYSLSSLPSSLSRSSSVRFAYCCLILPFISFQLPLTLRLVLEVLGLFVSIKRLFSDEIIQGIPIKSI